MIAVLVVVTALHIGATPAPAATSGTLEKCRALDKEFDTKNMPKPCQAAADDTTLAIPDRVEALRRLAFAHIVNGDDALAEPAFMKMLVFSPTADLPPDAGPKAREMFAKVRKRFDDEGKLAVTFTPPASPLASESVSLQVDVGDKLGRVVGARIKSTSDQPAGAAALEDKLVRNELGPGQLRFSGTVPEPKDLVVPPGRTVTYDVVFEGWDGQPIATPTPVHGSYVRPSSNGANVAGPDEGGGFPWLVVGGGAVGVIVIGAAVGTGFWCYNAGPCRTQEAWVRVQIHQGGT